MLITLGERTEPALVGIASGNGRSLILVFDALLGGYAGTMPVLWDDASETFRGLVCGEAVAVAEGARA